MLNRITDLKTGEHFQKRPVSRPDLSPERIFPGAYQVKVRIHPSCKWRLVEEYGIDSFVEQPDKSLLFTGRFADKDAIVCWIASFGRNAELLEPAELREDMIRYAKGIWEKYLES